MYDVGGFDKLNHLSLDPVVELVETTVMEPVVEPVETTVYAPRIPASTHFNSSYVTSSGRRSFRSFKPLGDSSRIAV